MQTSMHVYRRPKAHGLGIVLPLAGVALAVGLAYALPDRGGGWAAIDLSPLSQVASAPDEASLAKSPPAEPLAFNVTPAEPRTVQLPGAIANVTDAALEKTPHPQDAPLALVAVEPVVELVGPGATELAAQVEAQRAELAGLKKELDIVKATIAKSAEKPKPRPAAPRARPTPPHADSEPARTAPREEARSAPRDEATVELRLSRSPSVNTAEAAPATAQVARAQSEGRVVAEGQKRASAGYTEFFDSSLPPLKREPLRANPGAVLTPVP